MDTSKEYIKMCEKAVEIQKLCPFQEGDFILNKSANNQKGFIFVNYLYQPQPDCPDWELVYKSDNIKQFNIWLPRQDQLQEMVKDPDLAWHWDTINRWFQRLPLKVMEIYIPYGKGQTINKTTGLASDEQLWLAFVMDTKFNKYWNGEDWINGQ